MSVPDHDFEVRPLTILLAEDSPLHRRHALRLLEAEGHQVRMVNNGREALEALPGGRFDVILMDVEMPEIDGLTATRMIRAQEEDGQPRLPIVAVTSTEDPEPCFEAGMDAFLTKPLEPQLLRTTIENLLTRSAV